LSYADDERSYATNEFAIDYNSALLALLIDLRTASSIVYARSGRRALSSTLP
ncbi:MAG: hypothetical protein RLZZ450_3484, partial [Pseudomonadota bacterium]